MRDEQDFQPIESELHLLGERPSDNLSRPFAKKRWFMIGAGGSILAVALAAGIAPSGGPESTIGEVDAPLAAEERVEAMAALEEASPAARRGRALVAVAPSARELPSASEPPLAGSASATPATPATSGFPASAARTHRASPAAASLPTPTRRPPASPAGSSSWSELPSPDDEASLEEEEGSSGDGAGSSLAEPTPAATPTDPVEAERSTPGEGEDLGAEPAADPAADPAANEAPPASDPSPIDEQVEAPV